MRRAAVGFQTNCALGAVVLTSPLALYLPQVLWQMTDRLRRYSRNGLLLTIMGLALMYVLVSHVRVNVFFAQLVVVPLIMYFVSHKVHRDNTFSDRDVAEHSDGRYAVVRFGGMGVSKISFFLLVGLMGVQYLIACILIVLGLAYPTYKLNNRWVFQPKPSHTPDFIRGQLGVTPPIIR